MALSDYSDNPSDNANINGVNIAENCPPGNVNDAIRQLMADLASGTSTLGLALMAVMDAATARGLIQAAGASLAANALADNAPSANKIAYYTGPTSSQMTDLTAFARTLIAAADAAAAAAIIGAIGVGQTWQGVSRTYDTTYQNTTGRPIQVAVNYTPFSGGIYFQVSANGSDWLNISVINGANCVNIIIPNGHYYRIAGAASILNWAELR